MMKTSNLIKKIFKGNVFDLIFFFVADKPASTKITKTT
jgi:hypothetical protein